MKKEAVFCICVAVFSFGVIVGALAHKVRPRHTVSADFDCNWVRYGDGEAFEVDMSRAHEGWTVRFENCELSRSPLGDDFVRLTASVE